MEWGAVVVGVWAVVAALLGRRAAKGADQASAAGAQPVSYEPSTPAAGGWSLGGALAEIAAAVPVLSLSLVGLKRAPSGIGMRPAWSGALPRFGAVAWMPAERARGYLVAVLEAERRYGLPSGLLVRLIEQESAWDAAAVNRRSGAAGLGQFMPATAEEFGVDRFDAWSSIDGAARYLRWLQGYIGRGWVDAVAAYNWGVGNVRRYGVAAAPAETRDYVDRIGGSILGVNFAQAAAGVVV